MTLCFDQLRWANQTRQKEWDPTGVLPREFRGLEMGGEAGEMMELVVDMLRTSILTNLIGVHAGRTLNLEKKLARERLGIRGSRATKEELEDELGDLIATVDLLAMDAGIDLGEAVRRKFNKVSEKMGLETRLANGDLEDQWPSAKPLFRQSENGPLQKLANLFRRGQDAPPR